VKPKEKKKADLKKNKSKINCCMCFFSCFAGHRWRGREEGRKLFYILSLRGFSRGGA
jgi:hypothetical protein